MSELLIFKNTACGATIVFSYILAGNRKAGAFIRLQFAVYATRDHCHTYRSLILSIFSLVTKKTTTNKQKKPLVFFLVENTKLMSRIYLFGQHIVYRLLFFAMVDSDPDNATQKLSLLRICSIELILLT